MDAPFWHLDQLKAGAVVKNDPEEPGKWLQ
jgi:hypothetical protein